MLAAPYVLFASICGLLYRAHRRARRATPAETQAPVPPAEPAGVHDDDPA